MCAPHFGILIDFGYSHQGHKLLLQHLPAPSVAAGHARPPAPNIVRMNWSDGPPPTQLRNGDEGLFLTSPGRGAQRGSALRRRRDGSRPFVSGSTCPTAGIVFANGRNREKPKESKQSVRKARENNTAKGKRKLCTVAGLAWS